jgi:hypothetical protein
MYHKKSEKGQALVIIALAAVGLFAFTALAIDGSRVFSDRRHAQNAADTAALAAALAKIRTPNYPPYAPDAPNLAAIAAGEERAKSNGYVTDVTDADTKVEVRFCDEVLSLGLTPPCEGLPASADTPEEQAEYIQVVIRLTTKTTFARIIGRLEVPSIVTAIARAKPGSDEPFIDGRALAALSRDAAPAIDGSGNFTLDINNSGLFDNSSAGCAFATNGSSGSYTVDTAFEVVGGYCPAGNPTLSSAPVTAAQMPYPPAIDIPAPSITCTVNSVYNAATQTFSPGFHNNLSIPNGIHTFAPGNHCFNGGLNVSGNSGIIANDANFLISSGDFRMTSGDLTCNNLLVHTTGSSSGVHINANGTTNNCNGVTFYVSMGDVDLSGNSTNVFTAPGSGTYAGLLVYLPYGNSSTVLISGNSNSQFTGSIIAVDSNVQIVGNSATLALSTQIIGETVSLRGNGNIVINYNPAEQYAMGDPYAISLTK